VVGVPVLAMGDLSSVLTIPLIAIVVPLVLGRLPYFRRRDVVARRVAKAQLPRWVSLVELVFFAVSVGLLISLFFVIEVHAHQALHQGRKLPAFAPPVFSVGFIFWLIQILAPVMMALPLAMLFANLSSWLIWPIRDAENKIMKTGVPNYMWHDLNFGLIKFSLMALPVCVILTFISLIRV
jgi:hypothetical protein